MKLALYVHDFKLEIGHSNSLIELIRHLPTRFTDEIKEIEVVSFSTSPLEATFPEFQGRMRWTRVPFSGMKPVLLKSIYYQVWCLIYNFFFQTKDVFRVGIGISSLDVDAVSIQFIHHQWTKMGLKMERGHFLRLMYKKILFAYFEFCEKYLFFKNETIFFSPARFLTNFLKSQNNSVNAETIYSGVNLSRFELKLTPREEILKDLLQNYPVLTDLNLDKPIYLFVGAYERKGIEEALSLLVKNSPGAQFIVIGSPSFGRQTNWPKDLKIFPISFTREVPKFYALSDVFLFPTIYEPFGLVLFEAMAMGLTIITRKKDVGASELLDGLPEVYFCDSPDFIFPAISRKTPEEKYNLRKVRLEKLGDVGWEKSSLQLEKLLKSRQSSSGKKTRVLS